MKATVYHGARDVRVETVPDPVMKSDNDVILKITKSAICGSDLHFYRGGIPLDDGFIVGHEFMGVVEEVGKGVKYFKKGDKVVAPFWVSCGHCKNCLNGYPTACTGGGGCFGFGEALGGFWGGQAEYVRVPFADTTLEKVPESLPDERVLFLGDIFSTAYFCAEWGNIKPGNTVVVFGDGPLGLLATASARLFGPSKLITVGRHDYRLAIAKKVGADAVINSKNVNAIEKIKELTNGEGVDVSLECIGSNQAVLDAIKIAKPGGTVSFIGFM
ncbi:MAG TPA: alcohol dehydrogenase catalytic domain-containing protein, partial [Thermodesulfobacteriota bacterium]|nr:alcohol dehydrogenase catalytic domain-containing protein [Thermodesulfobacteriota bacterium]